MGRTFAPDQPIVVLNARTGKRHLIWSELDANPADPNGRQPDHPPGRNFDEGTRYIVALRRAARRAGA